MPFVEIPNLCNLNNHFRIGSLRDGGRERTHGVVVELLL